MKRRNLIAVLAMVLVLVLSVGVFAACNPKDNNGGNGGGNGGDGPAKTYDEISQELYDAALGEYYTAYQAAMAETDADTRYALMAIAEAKLLESGTFIPTSSNGGALAIGRVAPYTAPNPLWGTDSDRFHNVVVTNELITKADRDALKAKYAELKGTGTYEAAAKSYLTGKGYTLKDAYTIVYTADPKTWDILATYRSADAEAIVNLYDNLIEYDGEGNVKPALAESWTVSEDGLTYTFKIREGVKWVTKDGVAYADVTAQDWVDGLERALTEQATSYLVEGVIKNAIEFEEGEVEMSEVGVEAVDTYTLKYTLEAPCSYFLSMFIYNPLAPFCKAYAESVGENYATSPDYTVSCGPYVVSNYTAKNKIVFSANPLYWNKDNINIHTLTWLCYAESKDVTATYNDCLAGTLDGAGLNSTTIPLARESHAEAIYVSGTDATAFGFYVNINRAAYEDIQEFGMASSKTDAEKAVATAAFQNTNFRMALARSIDKQVYNAQVRGEDAALYSLGNMYTPGTFVQLGKDVTVKINGNDTTFTKGTYYGAMVQTQLNADMGDKAMKVWDPTADSGIGSSSGFDGWYNAEVANYYLDLAIQELAAQGVEVSTSNPITIDYPFYEDAIYTNRANALKQNIEKVFGGKVRVNLVSGDLNAWYYAGYFCETGSECNYDFYDCSGWGPDYQDPSTFLNTMVPGGDMVKLLGIF